MVVALCHTVAFVGVEPRTVEVQVQMANGIPSFTIVGLPDKAVGESRERVRAALEHTESDRVPIRCCLS